MEVVIRRIHPNIFVRIFVRILNGWTAGGTVFLGLCTAGGLIYPLLLPQDLCLFYKLSAFVLILIISVIVAYLKGRHKLLPSTIVDELSEENSYSAVYCSNNGLREADQMTKPYFGHGFIPFDQIEQWRLINGKGFVQINNDDGVLCACFVILGLEHSFFEQFTAGRTTEHDIDSSVILPFDRMKQEERIYVSGVVVRDPQSGMGHKRAVVMLWAMLHYIKKVFGLRKARTFYALGLTIESERLLNGIGFHICGIKENRKDECNLYKKWVELTAKIGDYSKMVSLHID